jgi:hypothetical protein
LDKNIFINKPPIIVELWMLSYQPVLDLVDAYDRGYNFTCMKNMKLNWIQSKKLLIDSKIRKKNPFEIFKWTIKSDDSSKELKENLKVMVSEIKGRNTSKC